MPSAKDRTSPSGLVAKSCHNGSIRTLHRALGANHRIPCPPATHSADEHGHLHRNVPAVDVGDFTANDEVSLGRYAYGYRDGIKMVTVLVEVLGDSLGDDHAEWRSVAIVAFNTRIRGDRKLYDSDLCALLVHKGRMLRTPHDSQEVTDRLK